MIRFLKTIAVIPFVLMLAAAPSFAQDFMTKKELLATIPGATLYGISSQDGKTKWAQTYSAGTKRGNIAGVWGGDAYKSKWTVKRNQWCEAWDGGSQCWKIQRINDTTLQAYKDNTKIKNVWRIK